MLKTFLRASFLMQLVLLVTLAAAAPAHPKGRMPAIDENASMREFPPARDPAPIPGLEAARARAELRKKLPSPVVPQAPNTFLPRMQVAAPADSAERWSWSLKDNGPRTREVTTRPGTQKGSWWSNIRQLWSGSGAPSTDTEINRLLHDPSPIKKAGKDVSINAAKVGQSYLAVKLPGNGMDALVLSRMKQQSKPFFVEGANRRVWLVTGATYGTFRAMPQQENVAVFAREAIKRQSIPTVAIRNSRLLPQMATAGRSSTASAPSWSRFAEMFSGEVPQGVKYLRAP